MRALAALALGVCVMAATASASLDPSAPAALAWAPPTLIDPVTIEVTNANRRLFLDDRRDYRLAVVEPLQRELWIEGGRNVVVTGGHVAIAEPGVGSAYQDNTAVKIRFGDPAGTVHVEGLLISGAYVVDAFAIATGRSVQLENVRVEGTQAFKGAHPDCVQTQRGVGALRIDRFTCTTQLQGIFLTDANGERVGRCEIRNTNITGAPGKHLFFQTSRGIRVLLGGVWLHSDRPWAPFGFQVFPQKDGRTLGGGYDRKRRAVVSRDGKRLWFVGSNISGTVRKGRPPGGDFVPAGAVGMGYTSPGYAASAQGAPR